MWGNASLTPPIPHLRTEWGRVVISDSDRFAAWKRTSGVNRVGGWAEPRTSVDVLENRRIPTAQNELRSLGQSARSLQSCPGFRIAIKLPLKYVFNNGAFYLEVLDVN
jgi:hypothetical protein